ncbi:NitT/TauT family transport system permease protein [Rubricella aquisinus]|uniref:NitT/TauT family transport system permease protein n=1 Tax=Rubricella aquisinus TaxID=2028108 RepID=A0A840WNJ7_9RHOB|nr:ABC transporter permease [Rubricella aquisinus]MBB5516638.1 NitT/TauT family transport system permease protein [Rubricella aquisinus]
MTLIIAALILWAAAWWLNTRLARLDGTALKRYGCPILFGVTLLAMWELLVRGLEVSPVILPPPSAVWVALLENPRMLWGDFVQTFVKGALSGYVIGCSAAVLTAILIDRSDFWKRGLLPVGNFVAALPIIGMAPIFVMWFGFGWESKAAIVVVMVFFPMLVNTVEGLRAADRMQEDLMRTYAASPAQTLTKLRLPSAAPFIFNGLKISSTLALIGAIVAEFFGSPTQGMGFRISTEVGRLALDLVWAVIAVAAVSGSAFYGVVTLAERAATFWHPSQRG